MSHSSAQPTKVLILTASMGEGHNTAARNIRDAILATQPGRAEVLVADPYSHANPVISRMIQRGYTVAINRYPRIWKVAFELLSHRTVIEGMGPMLGGLTAAVRGLIGEFQPDVIASTYPVFSFLMEKIRKSDPGMTVPLFTVITDSTQINSTWYRYPCNGSIVTDKATADVLCGDGVPRENIHVLGFPVGLEFEKLTSIPAGPPWRVLFFPSGIPSRAVSTLEELAKCENITVTVITGHGKSTHDAIAAAGLPGRGTLTGWVDNMPSLMAAHHLFIGKAGGATVQEAIAAQVPFLVSHVVPGQEEGNIALIEQSGIGALAAASPFHIANVLKGAFTNDAALWHAWKKNISTLQKPSASRAIAALLLKHAHRS